MCYFGSKAIGACILFLQFSLFGAQNALSEEASRLYDTVSQKSWHDQYDAEKNITLKYKGEIKLEVAKYILLSGKETEVKAYHLSYLICPETETVLRIVFLSDLASKEASQRISALKSLEQIDGDRCVEYALTLVNDEEHHVRTTTYDILAKRCSNEALWTFLQKKYYEFKKDEKFYTVCAILEGRYNITKSWGDRQKLILKIP